MMQAGEYFRCKVEKKWKNVLKFCCLHPTLECLVKKDDETIPSLPFHSLSIVRLFFAGHGNVKNFLSPSTLECSPKNGRTIPSLPSLLTFHRSDEGGSWKRQGIGKVKILETSIPTCHPSIHSFSGAFLYVPSGNTSVQGFDIALTAPIVLPIELKSIIP